MKNINLPILRSLRIPLPPLPEQKRIAEILRTVDDAIEKTDEAIERTERLKKGLMQRLLTRGIGHERFKKTELGEIPEEWRVVRLGEIGTFQYGITVSGQAKDTGIKLIRITDIKDWGIDWENMPYCEISNAEFEKYRVNIGDILFARIGATTGKTCYVDKSIPAVFASYLIRFNPTTNVISTLYLYYFTQSSIYWSQVDKLKHGQLKKGLNTKLLASIKLPLPPLEEQKQIAEILSTVDRKLELLRQRREKLERVKRGLMRDLLTGGRRVKVWSK